jgi:hypothetical protein
MKNRGKNTKNRSGGIMVGFKDNLSTCRCLIKSTKSVSVAVLALKSPKRHIHLDLFEKDKYSCCNSLKASSDEYLVYSDNLLRIVCLNCCGIKTRLQYPEFRTLIQSYDIDIITLQVCHEK